jgi:hypothetical protein
LGIAPCIFIIPGIFIPDGIFILPGIFIPGGFIPGIVIPEGAGPGIVIPGCIAGTWGFIGNPGKLGAVGAAGTFRDSLNGTFLIICIVGMLSASLILMSPKRLPGISFIRGSGIAFILFVSGIAGIVFGIVGIIFGIVGIVFGIVGIVFGIVGIAGAAAAGV